MKFPIRIKRFNVNKKYGKDTNLLILIAVSLSISVILFLIGFMDLINVIKVSNEMIGGIDFFVFGLLCAIGPIGFYNHIMSKRKREVEEHLPDFLREISSSTSSGMTVFDAIKSAADGDHGKLTPELKKMAAQLSWGISVNEALTNFARRIKTRSVERIVVTINKALEIGGNTSSVFEAAAREIDQTKQVELQRKSEMSLYSIVIFISFFVFLAVILIINTTIIAAFVDLQSKMPSGGAAARAGLQIAEIDTFALKNSFF